MFGNARKKKLRNKVIAAALGVAVMTTGILLNFWADNKENAVDSVVNQVEVDKNSETKDATKPKKENEGTDTQEVPETYLIKEVDGVVKVFLCDEEGNKELYLITSVPFDLLSESDQKLFTDGVILDTEEDLGKFLESFDS